jgi:hypothetical protein
LKHKIGILVLAGCVSACASPITSTVGGTFTNGQAFLTFTDGAGINLNLGDNVGDSVTLTAAQLGSFVIDRTCNTNSCTQSLPNTNPFTTFSLVFNFSVPGPTGGNPVTYTITSQPAATLAATVNRSGNSANFTTTVNADFDNTQQVITYSGGSFGLVLNDITFAPGTVNSAQTVGLSGTLTRLSNASVTAVPEPATLGLAGMGLIACWIGIRRRRAARV